MGTLAGTRSRTVRVRTVLERGNALERDPEAVCVQEARRVVQELDVLHSQLSASSRARIAQTYTNGHDRHGGGAEEEEERMDAPNGPALKTRRARVTCKPRPSSSPTVGPCR
jgi:hypothetical protein